MANFTDIKRIAAAAFGSLLLATITVGAAVGPARAVEHGPVFAAAAPDQDAARG